MISNSKLKSQIIRIVRNKDFFYISLVLLSAFIIRIFYLVLTKDQTLWWDEAEYMATAKNWAFDVPYRVNEQRPPIFQLFAAILLKMGFGETSLKFLLVVLPSVVLVLATYLLGKEMFNQKTGFFASIGTGLVWSILFWSSRFQPDFFSVTLQLFTFLFFWKFIKSDKLKFAAWTGLFAAFAFYFKISALLVPLAIGIFSLFYEGPKIITKKNYWVMLGAFIIGLIPFMLWQAISFGNPLAFGVSYSGDFNVGREPGWMTLNYFPIFLKQGAFILFILGLIITLGKTVINADILYKDKNLRKDSSIFSFLILLIVSLFYIFYIKGTIEDRWVFIIIPFSLFFVAKPLLFLEEKISSYSKIIASIFILICIIAFALPQLNHTTDLVNFKKSSYLPVKEASLLIKYNSNPEDKILSVSYTQATAYSEREVIPYPRMSIENFTKILYEQRPKFVMASIIEPNHPNWMVQQTQNEQGVMGILFPYFNSTIIVSPSPQNQLLQYDIKEKVERDGVVFTLFYPRDNFGGLVVYKIDYKS